MSASSPCASASCGSSSVSSRASRVASALSDERPSSSGRPSLSTGLIGCRYPSVNTRYSTSRTDDRRSGSSSGPGTWYGMRAVRMVRLARTSRWAMVGSGTRKARAMAGVWMPATVRSVRATRASDGQQRVTAGEDEPQPVIGDGSRIVDARGRPGRRWPRRPSVSAWSVASFSTSRRARRMRSMARRRAVVVIQAPGRSGTPSRRPMLERRQERVLDRVLGGIEVATQGRDEACQHPPALRAEDALHDPLGRATLVGHVRVDSPSSSQHSVSIRAAPVRRLDDVPTTDVHQDRGATR